MTRTVLTYGTFDLFHVGHLRLIERLAAMGDRLVVGVSIDEFNAGKGKRSVVSYDDRAAIVGAIRGWCPGGFLAQRAAARAARAQPEEPAGG